MGFLGVPREFYSLCPGLCNTDSIVLESVLCAFPPGKILIFEKSADQRIFNFFDVSFCYFFAISVWNSLIFPV